MDISTKVKAGKSQYISAEIDCRGQLVEEALGNIDKYLDDAYLSGLKQVMIIMRRTGSLAFSGQTARSLRRREEKRRRKSRICRPDRISGWADAVAAGVC